jgi:hypothetical protein
MPNSSAIASSASVRQRDLSGGSGEGCKSQIVAQTVVRELRVMDYSVVIALPGWKVLKIEN